MSEQVPRKAADSEQEKMLLGVIAQEAGRILYGSVTVEVTFRDGRIDRAEVVHDRRTVNLGLRDTQVRR